MKVVYEVNCKYLYADIEDAIEMAKTILSERIYGKCRAEPRDFVVNKNDEGNYSIQLIAPWMIWVGNSNLRTVIITTRIII